LGVTLRAALQTSAEYLVGLLRSERDRPELEGVIGCLVAPALLHIDARGDVSFEELVARAGRAGRAAFADPLSPINLREMMLEPCDLVFNTYGSAATDARTIASVTFTRIAVEQMETVFPARQQAWGAQVVVGLCCETKGPLSGAIHYNRAVINDDWVRGLQAGFRRAVMLGALAPDRRLASLTASVAAAFGTPPLTRNSSHPRPAGEKATMT